MSGDYQKENGVVVLRALSLMGDGRYQGSKMTSETSGLRPGVLLRLFHTPELSIVSLL